MMKFLISTICIVLTLGLASATELPGESCATAIEITSLPFCDQGSTADYHNDFDNDCVFTLGGKDVCYSYTPETDMTVSVSTCGTSFYSTASIWTGCGASAPQQVACHYHGCAAGDRGSCLTGVQLTGGVTYFFVVDSEDNRVGNPEDEGPYQIAVAEGSDCPSCDEILPVELISFTATAQNRSVELHWTTATEQNTDKFEIVRNGIVRGVVDAAGNSITSQNYTWIDDEVQNDLTYTYDLYLVDLDGGRQNLGAVNATPAYDALTVRKYALHQNYPNPFNPTTSITIDLVDAGFTNLRVFNTLGQQVSALLHEYMPRGQHTVLFNGADLPSGVYIYQLDANGFTAQRKMILMK